MASFPYYLIYETNQSQVKYNYYPYCLGGKVTIRPRNKTSILSYSVLDFVPDFQEL